MFLEPDTGADYDRGNEMRLVAWNMRRAPAVSEEAWGYFAELKPDPAVPQEVSIRSLSRFR